MAKIERVREVVDGRPGQEYWELKERHGWRLVGLEWEREAQAAGENDGSYAEVPYGLQIAPDCQRLEENRSEMEVLQTMLDLIGQDEPLSRVAEALNRQGFRTRQGTKWGIESVFQMLPRLIEVGPAILSGRDWETRRPALK